MRQSEHKEENYIANVLIENGNYNNFEINEARFAFD